MERSATALTPEEAETARAHWKSTVRIRAVNMIRGTKLADKIEKLTTMVGAASRPHDADKETNAKHPDNEDDKKECLNTETVAAWLNDESPLVPKTKELHTALMDALGLPTHESLKPKKDTRTNRERRLAALQRRTPLPVAGTDPLKLRLADTRETLERAWAEAFGDECKQSLDPADIESGNGRGSSGGKHNAPQRPDGNYDSRFLPDRTGDIRTTENIHEYLLLLRKKLGFTAEEMGGFVGIDDDTYRNWECGVSTPRRESLAALKGAFPAPVYERLVNILIDNRLRTIRGVLREHTDVWGVQNEHYQNIAGLVFAEMPRRYWHEVLDQAHNPNLYDTTPDTPRPDWVHHVIKAETQGEYISAVRHYLALSSEGLAEAVCAHIQSLGNDCTPHKKLIRGLETGDASLENELATQCITYFNARQTQAREGQIANGIPESERSRPFFIEAVLRAMPQRSETSEIHTNRAINHVGSLAARSTLSAQRATGALG